ncbi:YjbQ family protein [Candidatus Pacearchaeota archaeon]|nr:YjbQ family protein [Candidatus Pacearchaeota archaeon]
MQILKFHTKKKEEIIDITREILEIVKKSEVEDGACIVYVPHATCAIVINENYDKGVCGDILNVLEKIVPKKWKYKHNCVDNNAIAHIKSALIGPGKIIPISNGKLQLGKWQGIALAEFDGPRERQVFIEFLNR